MDPIREALAESYKPREIENEACLICRGGGPFALHLIEASLPDTGVLPPHFVAQVKRENRVRGGFLICNRCAPTCRKCGLPIRTRTVEATYAGMEKCLPKDCSIALGQGYCRHANFFRRLVHKEPDEPFVDPFAIYMIRSLLAPPKANEKPRPAQARPKLEPSPISRKVPPSRYQPGETIFGRYVIDRIFEGGMGRVYLVRNGAEQLVLKTLLGENTDLNAFQAEAQIWIQLGRHENIVQAFWVEEIAGMLCIAAEYIKPDRLGRGNLGDYIASGRVTLQQIIRWSAEFCYGMEHALERGLSAHRDIKPANLLVDCDGGLRITDFGIARAVTTPSHPDGRISGTLPYMPPEQWKGSSSGFPTDVYAFGVVLFQLCFGVLPWRASTPEELHRQHLAPRKVPNHPLAAIVERALAIDPATRFGSPGELLTAIEAAAFEQAIALPPKPQRLDGEKAEFLAAASLQAVGMSQKALEAAERLTSKYPDFAPGWTQLGRLKLERGDAQAAFIACSQAVALDATRSAPWNNLGLSLNKLGNSGQAVEAFERAIECDPQNAGAMTNLGSLLMALGHASKARALLERAIEIAPDNWLYWVNLGSLHRLEGAEQQALQCFRKGFDLAPEAQRPRLKPLLEKDARLH